ncbi:MAG: SDR family oxidoreductase [Kiritimatiellae bacterium]|nr:SDR family oxidoreductase [Kiritimatiellia bacterium]
MREIDFAGKVAVVTGAASGMGLMTAQEFARLGAKVVMCDVNADALDAAAKSIGEAAYPCAGDVREFAYAESAAKVAASLGGCDILITCAGGNEARCCKSNVPFYEQPVEVIDWGLDVNLKGAVYFARAVMPQMVAKKCGVICCLGSVTGFEGDGVGTMYGTAKSGLFNFVKGIAIAGGPHNVRALCVTPGPVLTRDAMSGMPTVLGRAAETHELVDVILFMCSDNASFVTGTNHVVDGGRLCMYQPYVPPKEMAK